MGKIIYAYPYHKNGIKVPNYYPSYELEWKFFENKKYVMVDVFDNWFLAEQMLRVKKIIAGKILTKNEKFLEEKINKDHQGNYIDYLFLTLRIKYWGKAEYEDFDNRENDFYKKIDKVKAEEKIETFICHR